MIEWFSANKLVLNMEKANILKFVTNNLPYCELSIGQKDKYEGWNFNSGNYLFTTDT